MTMKSVVIWILFFATSVYGHVALKVAVPEDRGGDWRALLRSGLSPWALTAFAAWMLSGVLWMAVLSEQKLFQASTISSLRYVLLCLSAVLFLRETMNASQMAGMALVAAGVFLVAR